MKVWPFYRGKIAKIDQEILERYNQSSDQVLVEVYLHQLKDFFDPQDPSPLGNKDLKNETARYIVESFKDIPSSCSVKILIHLNEENLDESASEDIINAFNEHFAFEIKYKSVELRERLAHGFKALLVGLSFLTLCVLASKASASFPGSFSFDLFLEGVTVLGWVSLWHPLQVFLYEWWPIVGARNLYRKILASPVEIVKANDQNSSLEASNLSYLRR